MEMALPFKEQAEYYSVLSLASLGMIRMMLFLTTSSNHRTLGLVLLIRSKMADQIDTHMTNCKVSPFKEQAEYYSLLSLASLGMIRMMLFLTMSSNHWSLGLDIRSKMADQSDTHVTNCKVSP